MKKKYYVFYLAALTAYMTVCFNGCGKSETAAIETPLIEEETVEAEEVEEEIRYTSSDLTNGVTCEDGHIDMTGVNGHIGKDYDYGMLANIEASGSTLEEYIAEYNAAGDRPETEYEEGVGYVNGLPIRSADFYIDKLNSEEYQLYISFADEGDIPYFCVTMSDEFYYAHIMFDEELNDYVLSDEDKASHNKMLELEMPLYEKAWYEYSGKLAREDGRKRFEGADASLWEKIPPVKEETDGKITDGQVYDALYNAVASEYAWAEHLSMMMESMTDTEAVVWVFNNGEDRAETIDYFTIDLQTGTAVGMFGDTYELNF